MRGLLVSALEVLLLGHCVFAVNVHEKLCLSLLLKEDGPDPRLESSKPEEEEGRGAEEGAGRQPLQHVGEAAHEKGTPGTCRGGEDQKDGEFTKQELKLETSR